jgi:hypothetical protein
MSPAPGVHTYDAGASVAISAIPDDGYVFSQWAVTGSIEVDEVGSASTSATINGDGSITATFSAAPAVLDHFDFDTIIGPKTVGTPFSITIRAKDQYDVAFTSYAGTNTLTYSAGAISPTGTTAFTAGVWTGDVTVDSAGTGVTISTSGSGKPGISNTFDVTAPSIPTTIDWYTDPENVELGEDEEIMGILYRTDWGWFGGLNGKTINIVFTAPNGTEITRTDITEWYFFAGVFYYSFTPDAVGTWSVSARFDGDSTYGPSQVGPTTFTVSEVPQPHFVDAMQDLHAPTDVGTHSNFPSMQSGPDGVYDTLTETGIVGTSSYRTPGDGVQDECGGSSTSYRTVDDNTGTYWNHNSNENHWIIFDMDQNYEISRVRIYQGSTGNQQWGYGGTVNVYVSTSSSGPWTLVLTAWNPADGTTGWKESSTFTPTIGRYIRLEEVGCSSQSNHRMHEFDADAATLNYQLNLEVQFTGVTDYAMYTQLCIQTGNLSPEDIRVDYWNGASWVNLRTDLNANSLNVITVALTGPIYEIRFTGSSESSDTTQSSWQIDCVYLNVP